MRPTDPDSPRLERADVLVVGAGPAGAVAARELARGGLDVLLVDRARFPRQKVCGGCLGAGARASLMELGLWEPLAVHSVPLRQLHVAAGGRALDVRLAGGAAVDRGVLDPFLLASALSAGARFVEGCRVRLEPARADDAWRRARLGEEGTPVRARLVLDASGLGGRIDGEAPDEVAPHSRVGLGARLEPDAHAPPPGRIEMALGRAGYVGRVRLADGSVDLAAALDPRSVAALGPAGALAAVRVEAGLEPLADLGGVRWSGTPALTRRPRRASSTRRLALGDAAGYVEPFTGEGIGWAIASARAAAGLVLQHGLDRPASLERAWDQLWERRFAPRHRACGRIAGLLRRPWALRGMSWAAGRAPLLVDPVLAHFAAHVHRPWHNPLTRIAL